MKNAGPLQIERQGFFWVGVERVMTPLGTLAHRAMFVQFQIPAIERRGQSIVMVHGGGGQGTDYLGTPDGRPGWAEFFVRRGYDVYVVDRPEYGRSPQHPSADEPPAPTASYEMMTALMLAPEREEESYPQAKRHSQWPAGDVALDQFMSSQGPLVASMSRAHLDMRRCGAALLDRIGPATLLTHSMGAPFGWLVADERPKLVEAIIAVEPLGPPFTEMPGSLGTLDWGLTATPLTYDPVIRQASELRREIRPAKDAGCLSCYVQSEPARQLTHLVGRPIGVFTAEASWMAQHNHGIVDYLRQAGADVEHIRLESLGVRGNGHMMMLENNSDEIAAVIVNWLQEKLGNATCS